MFNINVGEATLKKYNKEIEMKQKIILQSGKIVKIFISFLLSTIIFLSLTACGKEELAIENYEWNLRYAYQVEDNQIKVIATDKYDTIHPNASIVEVTLKAEDGKITILNKTNSNTYTGTYILENAKPKEKIYKVLIDGQEGYATVAMTTYSDDSEEPTMPINLGEYSLYFYSKKINK